jgi:hypothetical protein
VAQTQGKTGKAGSITISGNVIPITRANPKVSMEFADSTDSGNYDPTSGNLYKSQLAGDTQIVLAIEGYWDAATTSTNITGKIQNPAAGPYPLVVKLDGSTTYCSGNFDLTDVDLQVEIPGATMISFTATARSNGKYTLN